MDTKIVFRISVGKVALCKLFGRIPQSEKSSITASRKIGGHVTATEETSASPSLLNEPIIRQVQYTQ